MDKVKKVYIDSRYKNNDSESNSDFKSNWKNHLIYLITQSAM